MRYVDHIVERGVDFFAASCRLELEGIAIVAKWRTGTYQSRAYTSWAKIRNPKYSQWDGRRDQGHKTTGAPNGRELFSQDRV
jgi:hypothetical protein